MKYENMYFHSSGLSAKGWRVGSGHVLVKTLLLCREITKKLPTTVAPATIAIVARGAQEVRAKHFLPKNVCILLYKSLIKVHLGYCNLLLGSAPPSHF
jgi:hypothetical protein